MKNLFRSLDSKRKSKSPDVDIIQRFTICLYDFGDGVTEWKK